MPLGDVASRYLVWTESDDESLTRAIIEHPGVRVLRSSGSTMVVLMTDQTKSALQRALPSVRIEKDIRHFPI